MDKGTQLLINEKVVAWEQYAQSTRHLDTPENRDRLYSCNAYTYRIPIVDYNGAVLGTGHVLVSYKTPVALLFDTYCFDFLRYVYGYTATSAQHISKACKKYDITDKQTYYPI